MNALYRITGSWFFSGYLPLVPGSWGTLAAVPLYLLLQVSEFHLIFSVLLAISFFFIGVHVADVFEKELGRDPGVFVLDEVVGYLLTTMVFVEANIWVVAILGFFVFRVFDVLKPLGVARLEDYKHGWGVMLDDVLAGIYGMIVMNILLFIF